MREPREGSATPSAPPSTPSSSFEIDTLVAALVGSSNAGVIRGIDGLIVDANDAFLGMVGLDRSVLAGGFDWRRLMPNDGFADDERRRTDNLTSGRCEVWLTRFCHRDGTWIPVLIVGFGISHDPFTWTSIVIDVASDERLATLAAAPGPDRPPTDPESDWARTVLDSVLMIAPVGIAVVDHRGRIIRTNREFDALADTLPSLARHAPDGDDVDGGTLLARTFDKVLKSGQPVTETMVNDETATDDDAQIFAHAYPVPVDGDEAGIGVVLIDVTESARPERERSHALSHRLEAQTAALDQLQTMLLPDLPQVDKLFVEARYVPADTVVNVGGDWYDCVVLPDGRAALSVGDARGHGLRSIRVMDAARNALRTLVLTGHSIADTIRHANTVMCGVDHATACLAILDPDTGELEYAIAGHPPPLIRRWDGSVDVLEAPRGMLLGAVPDIEVTVGHTTLAPMESLVIYTDGLIERRTEVIDTGIERLRMALRGAGQRRPPFGDRLLDVVSDGISHDDDVCLLVATRIDGATDSTVR
jgi:PAS domain S-box-containing protein